MSNKIEKKALTAEEAESKIRRITILGSVSITNHCYYESMKNRNYDTNDIINVLSKGRVRELPKYDKKCFNWKCKVEGNVVEGEKATVIVAILSHRELLCITIMDK